MEDWIIFSIITLVLWGVWGFFIKLALRNLSWQQVLIYSEIVVFVIIISLILFYKPAFTFQTGTIYAILAGTVGILGAFTFYLALNSGKASVVIPFTALYPIIAIALAFLILKESITIFQGVGIALAVAAVFLMPL